MYLYEKTIVIANGNEEKLHKALEMRKSSIEEGIVILQGDNFKGTSSCSAVNPMRVQNGDRRITVCMRSYTIFGYLYSVYSIPVGWYNGYCVYQNVTSQKKNWRNKWKSHKTRFYFRNVYYQGIHRSDGNSPNDITSADYIFDYKTYKYSIDDPIWTLSCPEIGSTISDNSARSLDGVYLHYTYFN